MHKVLLVGFGGFLGSILRFFVSNLPSATHFPLATFLVNGLGSFAIGILLGIGHQKIYPYFYYFLIPGFLGGFTTFSAFSAETVLLLTSGQYPIAILNVGVTIIIALCACALGLYLGKVVI